jgi:hypothetical protein
MLIEGYLNEATDGVPHRVTLKLEANLSVQWQSRDITSHGATQKSLFM